MSHSGFSGASSPGVNTQMVAIGAMEAFLIKPGKDRLTLFRFRYARHTNFAMEPVYVNLDSVAFGRQVSVTLPRTGDLVHQMYVEITLPPIYGCTSSSNGCTTGFNSYPGAVMTEMPLGSGTGDPNYIDNCALTDQAIFQMHAAGRGQTSTPDAVTGLQATARGQWLADTYGANAAQVPYDPALFSQAESLFGEGDAPNPWVHWHNAAAQKVVSRAALIVGSHTVDTFTNDFLYMWEEVSGKAGKRLEEMIGKRTSRKQLIRDAAMPQKFWCPLPWWFTEHPGNSLALVSLQYHGVIVSIDFAPLNQMYVRDSANTVVVRADTNTVLGPNDIQARLDVNYIYLDMEERDRFATANFDQLITTTQSITQSSTSRVIQARTEFSHPVIELLWAVRRKCHFEDNNSFNYSGIDGRDPIDTACIYFNNQPRFEKRPAQYFRLVQPYQHHSSIPRAHVYCYSYALSPEEPQPTGAANYSRIDSSYLSVELQPGLSGQEVDLLIFARSRMILRYLSGVGGSLFNA